MIQNLHLKSISDLNKILKQDGAKHPLVSVIDFTKVEDTFKAGTKVNADFYSIIFKNYSLNKLKYGRQYCDFQEGNLICIAPKQAVVLDDEVEVREDKMGWGLFFHPDLIRKTALGSKMREYSFFSYEITEALHLSEKEKKNLFDCIVKIENELSENIDIHSQTLIVSNIELLLNYCARYYGRQFITRRNNNREIISVIEKLLTDYFNSDSLKKSGLPSVKYLSEQVNLSPNYLSDLLKKEIGLNAQELIHYYLIEQAKSVLLTTDLSVSEIAYLLGFEYPQYFSKLFKQKTGSTPVEFRNSN